MSQSITIQTILEFLRDGDIEAVSVGLIEFMHSKLDTCKLTDNRFCYSHSGDFPCIDELVRQFNDKS